METHETGIQQEQKEIDEVS